MTPTPFRLKWDQLNINRVTKTTSTQRNTALRKGIKDNRQENKVSRKDILSKLIEVLPCSRIFHAIV